MILRRINLAQSLELHFLNLCGQENEGFLSHGGSVEIPQDGFVSWWLVQDPDFAAPQLRVQNPMGKTRAAGEG